MKPELNDLRILKLAEMYETAYERFVHEMAERVVKDDKVRERLRVITQDGHHERIVAEIDRLNKTLSSEDAHEVERAALLDVLEVERNSRDFFITHIDQLHDPRLVSLFRAIAQDEERHVEEAERALSLHHGARPRNGAEWSRKLRMILGEDEVPLREGVSDYGPKTHLHGRP